MWDIILYTRKDGDLRFDRGVSRTKTMAVEVRTTLRFTLTVTDSSGFVQKFDGNGAVSTW